MSRSVRDRIPGHCPYNASDDKVTAFGWCVLTAGHAGPHRLAAEDRPARCQWIEGHGYLHSEACERARAREGCSCIGWHNPDTCEATR